VRTAGWRNRDHPSYWAFLVHRVSGLLLSMFLPLHFWVLGRALAGEAALDDFCAGPSNRYSGLRKSLSSFCWPRISPEACACCWSSSSAGAGQRAGSRAAGVALFWR
jgi:hypothetical protein